ncbi:multimerin-2-like [Haliotis asinina]|uniref:multimerin-2-like n=1 Tax=Haliotis asinina TaxID=109174 RepID=UPI003531A46F
MLLCLAVLFSIASGLIMPLTKPNGQVDVNSLVSHVSTLETAMTSLQSQFQTNTVELESVKSKLKATEDKLQTTSDQLLIVQAKQEALQKTTKNMSRLVNELDADVAFEVSQKQEKTAWTTLKFDTVLTNIGKAYSPRTGVFRAPVSGTYLFWADVMMYNHHNDHCLYMNGPEGVLGTGYPLSQAGHNHGTIHLTTVSRLTQGSRITFSFNSSSTVTHVVVGGGASSYGGTLIRAH